MPLLINTKQFEIFVRILQGEGDGHVVYLDNHGGIHVVGGGGDPRIDKEKVNAAVKQIEAGVNAFHAATTQNAR